MFLQNVNSSIFENTYIRILIDRMQIEY